LPTQGLTPAPVHAHHITPLRTQAVRPSAPIVPAARPAYDADPPRDVTPASYSGHESREPSDQHSHPDLGSARQFELKRRQDVADERAGAAEGRYQELAQDVRQAHVAAASTATLVQHMMDRLDTNHQEHLRRASDLAAAATASRDRDLERWTILETRLTATREADNSTLDARITPLVTGLIAKITAALAMDGAAARADVLDALVQMRAQSDTREQASTAALECIRCAVRDPWKLCRLRHCPLL